MTDIIKAIVLAVIMASISGVFAFYSNGILNAVKELKAVISDSGLKYEKQAEEIKDLREELIRRPCFVNHTTKVKERD